MRPASSWSGITCAVFASAFLGCGAEVLSAPPDIIEVGQSSLVKQDPAVVSRAGVLVFRDRQALQETLDTLMPLDAGALRGWNRSMGFVSLREVFEEVVEQEAAIDEHYERLARSGPDGARLVPQSPVHSQAYLRAVLAGRLRVIREDAGEYFDYGIREAYLASVLDADGRVAIGGVLMQYLPEGVKEVPFKSLEDLESAKAALASAPAVSASAPASLAIIPTVATCRYYSNASNGWTYDGRRRFRAWIEEDSRTEWSYTRLYVTNVLRMQAMYRNWLGNWNYAAYTADVNLAWYWGYYLNGVYRQTLPVPTTTMLSPASFSVTFNNYAANITPHINGYYSVPEPNYFEPVVLQAVDGTVVVYGGVANTLFVGAHGSCTVQ